MVVWVNLHIYFVFGFFILGCFFLESLKRPDDRRSLFMVGVLCLLASLCNPVGYRLALEPFRIFDNYGYMIVENQSVWFFLKRHMFLEYLVPFFGMIALLIAGGISNREPLRNTRNMSLLMIAVVFMVMSSLAIRNFPLLGIFAVPVLAALYGRNRKWAYGLLVLAMAFDFSFAAVFPKPAFGIGLGKGINASARFFIEQKIQGPIFNNYDIGGYLIYHLFPQEKVFVDNRPEAYPASFFADTYIPMQEDESKWKAEEARYGFNAIYFFWHDQTPWAQAFLLKRVRDPEWVPVYVDSYALIFVKNVEANKSLIERYRIPADRFSVKQ
jgi:hypothetical protein